MPGNPNHLLNDPWISTVDGDGDPRRRTLPQVLAELTAGRELEFTALQGHQQQAWYAFLVQLCALVLARQGGDLERDAAAWTAALATLGETPTAWQLVVDDLAQPAFFQPPVPEGTLAKFKRQSASPEILEVLIAAKNHDIKADRFGVAEAEHWAFALLTLQTMEGFLGRGNYGIARMNGGFSSRPETALASGLGWSERLRRDVPILLAQRDGLLDRLEYDEEGVALLWLEPWQGGSNETLFLEGLDPFFIEVCRRVRLTRGDHSLDGGIVGQVAPSDASRVAAKELSGNVGDPWTPIRNKDAAALTVSEGGFHYRLLSELLFDRKSYSQPAALEMRPDDRGDLLASFRVLVRGQGKTGGFHERHIPLPGKVVRRLGQEAARQSLAEDSQWRIEHVRETQKKILKPALLMLLQERVQAAPGLNWKDERANPWLDRFDQEVNAVFFECLFRDATEVSSEGQPLTAEERNVRWKQKLYDMAKDIFKAASQVLTPSGIHRFRALARAESYLESRSKQLLIPSHPAPSTPMEGMAP